MCSQEELAYISEGFSQNVRGDGRQADDLRPIVLDTAQLVQASGSARLKLGDTDVLVAVKVTFIHCALTRPELHLTKALHRLSLGLPRSTGLIVATSSLLSSAPLAQVHGFRCLTLTCGCMRA